MKWQQTLDGPPELVVATLDSNTQTPEPVRELIKSFIAQVPNAENVMVSTGGNVDVNATPPHGNVHFSISFSQKP